MARPWLWEEPHPFLGPFSSLAPFTFHPRWISSMKRSLFFKKIKSKAGISRQASASCVSTCTSLFSLLAVQIHASSNIFSRLTEVVSATGGAKGNGGGNGGAGRATRHPAGERRMRRGVILQPLRCSRGFHQAAGWCWWHLAIFREGIIQEDSCNFRVKKTLCCCLYCAFQISSSLCSALQRASSKEPPSQHPPCGTPHRRSPRSAWHPALGPCGVPGLETQTALGP